MENILYGFANSMFQSSKVGDCGESNWSNAIDNNKTTKSNVKISHWENWKNDIAQMKNNFRVSTYRMSIEWSHIEPIQGEYDHSILAKYMEIIEYCISLQIEPMLTLHHFNEPMWFSEIGGFENEDNICYFVNFSKLVYEELSMVKLWCTFNEPALYAFMGYLLGGFPPFKHNLNLTVTVLKNLLQAHVRVYFELKAIDDNRSIGIVHNVLIFKQLYTLDPISYYLTSFFNRITNDLLIEFFSTGNFKYSRPLLGIYIEYNEPNAKISNDFIGLNFYANPVVGPNLANLYGATCFSAQEMGDMYLPLDPDGFSSAIDLISSLAKPIYITEIGVADHTDLLRNKFIRQYINVIEKKVSDGCDIRGYYLWTFRDNYEWNQEAKLFGFHDIDGNERPSCNILREILFANLLEYE